MYFGNKNHKTETDKPIKTTTLNPTIQKIKVKKFDPLKTYSIIREEFDCESFLLESVEGPEKTAKYSFIGFDPFFEFQSKGQTVVCDGNQETCQNPYEFLKQKFYEFETKTLNTIPFQGGLVGYFSY
ncbi:MAG: hypothetical protein KAS30_00365, partial [Candidatus Diapherotrites archaeon]|nr:hypothetical protein [Candidatus Diapherotrites archaeon]